MNKYKILLGGLGDDAHSIGSNLIKMALEENGFLVSYLGIQNTIEEFIQYSEEHDIILISCINGHSELYLNNDHYNLKNLKYRGNKLWYVGGNLSVDKSDDYIIRLYREKGFTDVFPKPIDTEQLLYHIKSDIKRFHVFPEYTSDTIVNYLDCDEDKIAQEYESFETEDKFEKLRKEILLSWPTGKGVSYEIAKQNHKGTTNMDQLLWNTRIRKLNPLVQPRTGVAGLEEQYNLFNALIVRGIDIASIQLDAASRRLYFDKAQEGLEKSISLGTSTLNGFPVPIHGVNGVKKLSHIKNLPFQIRAGAPDHRFVYEVGIAGGATGIEGGFLCYLLPYEKKMNPYTCLPKWKYVDHLCGIYQKKYGITINREFFGPLTTTLLEPSIPIVINIVESLSAAMNGVKSISVGLAEQGNRTQDIASIRVLDKCTQGYLHKYGFTDVRVTTVFHQYMGAFPNDELKAEQLIEESSVTAALSGATRIMTKTPVEAIKIPDVLDNCRGVQLTHKGIQRAKDYSYNHQAVEYESKLIETEVSAIMNMVEFLGNGNIEIGAIKAVESGIIDIPFSPNIYNKNQAFGFRNLDGAIRFTKCDQFPFPEWVKEKHQQDLYQRMMFEGEHRIYSVIERDVTRIGKCDYKKWPLKE